MQKNFFVIYLLLIIDTSLFAQNKQVMFKHLSADEGLPSNYISSISQDQLGFMWFGTAEGISRYDGYRFQNFSNIPSDTASLINNEVRCIVPDNNNGLWIGTQKGLTYLDLERYEFIRYDGIFKEKKWINTVCFVDDQNIMFGTLYDGLYLFNHKEGSFIHFLPKEDDEQSLIHSSVNDIIKDKNGYVWIATNGGLDRLNLQNRVFDHLLTGANVQNICFDPDGNIVATGIFDNNIYTIASGSLKIISVEKLDKQYNEKPKKVIFDRDGNRWSGIQDGGIFLKTIENNTHHWEYSQYNNFSLSTNSILALHQDKDENIWVGTFDGGINLMDHNQKPFIQVKVNYMENGLQSNHIRSLFQDRDGDIWVGTKSVGMLSKFNRRDLTFKHYRHDPKDPNSLNDVFVLSMEDGPPGYLFVGTLTGGLNILDKKTGKFKAIKHDPNNPNSLASNAINSLFNDGDELYIGHINAGLDVMNIKTGNIAHYENTKDSGNISDNRIRTIFKDSKQQLWIGTINGLNIFDQKNKSFASFMQDNDSSSISYNNITSIAEDKNGNIWIGTTHGFNKWNPETKGFTIFDAQHGFPSKSARSIQIDEENNLWISTDNGLVKFDPDNNKYRHFLKADGIVSNELLYKSLKTSNGELMFGSNNGLLVFNPKEIIEKASTPNIVFTDFKLYNNSVTIGSKGSPLKKHISYTESITLNHKQSVITFEFCDVSYSAPEKSRYAYFLEGFDINWNYINSKRTATYTNLPSGEYVFKVRGTKNSDFLDMQGNEIKLKILPPPWKSWWAYCLYVIFIALVLLKLRDISIKRIHAAKEHELDQMKIKFFMNISHEFRTPLSLMLSPLKKIDETVDINLLRPSLKIVQRSASKLLDLVNQLLDFRKLDIGGYKLETKYGDVVEFTKRICSVFEAIALEKGIELKFFGNKNLINAWIDPDKIEKILNNLLSNAIKYTNPGGEVLVYIDKLEGQSLKNRLKNIGTKNNAHEGHFQITIKDTGIGISKKDIKHIFERFYQADQTKAGTGIGLNLVKSFVELHEGEIDIDSEPNYGTTFVLKIPIGNGPGPENGKLPENPGFENSLSQLAYDSLIYDLESTDKEDVTDPGIDKILDYKNQENKVVLIVEDNKLLRKQISKELKQLYQVKEARDGEEGLAKTKSILPDIIITDIMMPKMDGIQLCKRVKEDITTSHIPVIMLTAKTNLENKIDGFETGADEYIPKPFNMGFLLIRIKTLIRSRDMLRQKYSESKILLPANEFTSNNLDEAFLEKATSHVLENIDNPDFSIVELREKLGMSRSKLFNKLQILTNQNPSVFIRTIRLKYAAKLLMNKEHSVKDVCYMSGFNSPAYFIKVFRELYGKTPKEFFVDKLKETGN